MDVFGRVSAIRRIVIRCGTPRKQPAGLNGIHLAHSPESCILPDVNGLLVGNQSDVDLSRVPTRTRGYVVSYYVMSVVVMRDGFGFGAQFISKPDGTY